VNLRKLERPTWHTICHFGDDFYRLHSQPMHHFKANIQHWRKKWSVKI